MYGIFVAFNNWKKQKNKQNIWKGEKVKLSRKKKGIKRLGGGGGIKKIKKKKIKKIFIKKRIK